jgi:hypothetical protein
MRTSQRPPAARASSQLASAANTQPNSTPPQRDRANPPENLDV